MGNRVDNDTSFCELVNCMKAYKLIGSHNTKTTFRFVPATADTSSRSPLSVAAFPILTDRSTSFTAGWQGYSPHGETEAFHRKSGSPLLFRDRSM
jgi:hypothetical protein